MLFPVSFSFYVPSNSSNVGVVCVEDGSKGHNTIQKEALELISAGLDNKLVSLLASLLASTYPEQMVRWVTMICSFHLFCPLSDFWNSINLIILSTRGCEHISRYYVLLEHMNNILIQYNLSLGALNLMQITSLPLSKQVTFFFARS